jgi:riboflavin kinase/FMN adenylyltransferase
MRVSSGAGRVLVAAYGILALAAFGRSAFQIFSKFDTAPLAYMLSAVAAAVYVVITVTLLLNGPAARVVTWVSLIFELAGVLGVGTLSLINPSLFPHDTVWSVYGRGYLFIPLVLPIIGLWWLSRHRFGRSVAARPSVVTIGKFDGLHLGHMKLIDDVVSIARREQLQSAVVTFDRHPAEIVDPGTAPALLAHTAAQNVALTAAGIDRVVVLPFDAQLANLTPEEFVDQMLVRKMHARVIVVGRDFRFGHNAAGTVDVLSDIGARRGIRVVVADDVVIDGRRVSSSWVREALDAGNIPLATSLLGHTPRVIGEVVHGLKRGRELGFPTANLGQDARGYIPADGVYACWVHVGRARYPSSVSIGLNPTFGDVTQRSVEAFLIDARLDLYGKVVEIEFLERLRGMIAFPGMEPLIEQMNDDVRRCREILKVTS